MEETEALLERLDRIEALDRDGAPPSTLLPELRALVHEAEAWPRRGITVLPNQQSAWLLPTWIEAGTGEHPFAREPVLDWPSPSPRPGSIVAAAGIEGDYGGLLKHLAKEAGAIQTGLNLVALPP